MRPNGSRHNKISCNAKADRIIENLNQKPKPSTAQRSRKIQKKRNARQRNSHRLDFKTSQGDKKHLTWVLPKKCSKAPRRGAKNRTTTNSLKKSAAKALAAKEAVKRANSCMQEEKNVNYGDLLINAYEEYKTESSLSKSFKPGSKKSVDKLQNKGQKVKFNDCFTGIEYDPMDNYFYLISHKNESKKALFKNKAINESNVGRCFVVNPRVVESIKKNYELDCLLC